MFLKIFLSFFIFSIQSNAQLENQIPAESSEFISYEQFVQLPPVEQVIYLQAMRILMVGIEQVFNGELNARNTSEKEIYVQMQNFLKNEGLVPTAFGKVTEKTAKNKPSNLYIYAGWIRDRDDSTDSRFKCPSEKNKVLCNPLLFGENSCLTNEESLKDNNTELCFNKYKNSAAQLAHKISSNKNYKKEWNNFIKKFNEFKKNCNNSPNKKLCSFIEKQIRLINENESPSRSNKAPPSLVQKQNSHAKSKQKESKKASKKESVVVNSQQCDPTLLGFNVSDPNDGYIKELIPFEDIQNMYCNQHFDANKLNIAKTALDKKINSYQSSSSSETHYYKSLWTQLSNNLTSCAQSMPEPKRRDEPASSSYLIQWNEDGVVGKLINKQQGGTINRSTPSGEEKSVHVMYVDRDTLAPTLKTYHIDICDVEMQPSSRKSSGVVTGNPGAR